MLEVLRFGFYYRVIIVYLKEKFFLKVFIKVFLIIYIFVLYFNRYNVLNLIKNCLNKLYLIYIRECILL